jgi:hypothetical protein
MDLKIRIHKTILQHQLNNTYLTGGVLLLFGLRSGGGQWGSSHCVSRTGIDEGLECNRATMGQSSCGEKVACKPQNTVKEHSRTFEDPSAADDDGQTKQGLDMMAEHLHTPHLR